MFIAFAVNHNVVLSTKKGKKNISKKDAKKKNKIKRKKYIKNLSSSVFIKIFFDRFPYEKNSWNSSFFTF